jgi:hypothetical protein
MQQFGSTKSDEIFVKSALLFWSATLVAGFIFAMMDGPHFLDSGAVVVSRTERSIDGNEISGLAMQRWNERESRWEFRPATETEKSSYISKWSF